MNLAQASSTEQNIENVLAGDDDVIHQSGTLKKGIEFPQYAVVAREKASAQIVLHDPALDDGSEIAVGILVHAVNTIDKEITAPYFTGGAFFATALVWDDALDEINKRKAVFDRTMIRIAE